MRSPFAVLLTISVISAMVLGPALGVGQQGPTTPQNPTPQNNGVPNPQVLNGQHSPQNPAPSPSATPLQSAINQINAAKAKPGQAPPLILAPISVANAMVGQTVTFNAQVYDRKPSNQGYSFALQGAPNGAYIDPQLGGFTWVPLAPGTYAFYVWVMDNGDNARQAFQQVVIDVSPPYENFGYSFFEKSRATILARLFLIRNGYTPGLTTLGTMAAAQTNSVLNPGAAGQTNAFPVGAPNLTPFLSANGQNPFAAAGNQFTPATQSSGYMPPMSPFGGGNAVTGTSPSGGVSFYNTSTGSFYNTQRQGAGQIQQSGVPIATTGGQQGTATSGLSGQIPQGMSGQSAGQGLVQGGSQGPNYPSVPGLSSQTAAGASQSLLQQMQAGLGQGGFGQTGQVGGQQTAAGQGFQNPLATGQLPGMQIPGQYPGVSSQGTGQAQQFLSQPFQPLQNQVFNIPNSNGLPSGPTYQDINALLNIVSPFDELGYNVYMPSPDRYQLGPGDLLTARVSSPTMAAQDYDLKVNEQGDISIPEGNIIVVVRGKTVGEAEKALSSAVAKQFRDAKVELTLKRLRSMTIHITGDAFLPGNYQVPAVATLINTLYVCGGPSDDGSLRLIELQRANQPTKIVDLYRFFTSGSTKEDIPLEPGDVIFIPPAKTRVTIKGEVPRPAIYEAIASDTLKDLIRYAGGPKPTGVTQRVYVETEDPGVGHIVKDVDLNGPANAIAKVYDGDSATVLSVRDDVLNELKMEGDVDQPGRYEYKQGMTVADLILNARGLRPDAYTGKAELYRRNPDKSETLIPIDLDKALKRDPSANIPLAIHDRLLVFSYNDVKWKGDRTFTVSGEVQKPGTFTRADNMRVADAVLLAGGPMPDAFLDAVYLQRMKPDGTTGDLVKLNFKRLAAGDPSQNVLLEDHDLLTVQSFKQANYVPDQTVNIFGAVQAPGNYVRGNSMRVSDLIQEAGGVLPNNSGRIEITHARTLQNAPRTLVALSDVAAGDPNADVVLQDGDLVSLTSRSDIDLVPRKVMIVGEVARPGAYTIGHNTRLSEVIGRAGGIVKDSFVEGTQFYRDPSLLVTDTAQKVTPRIQNILQIVAADEYTRALALSVVQKAQFLKLISTTQSISVPGLPTGTASSPSISVPTDVWQLPSVTQARPLTPDDLTPVGNIAINLDRAVRRPGSNDDLVMQDGDIVVIPSTPSTVTIVGAVVTPNSAKFIAGKSVQYYVLHSAGGFVEDAAKDDILIIRANGSVDRGSLKTIVRLGDQIFVPTKVTAAKFTDRATEIDSATKSITAGAILIALLRAVIR